MNTPAIHPQKLRTNEGGLAVTQSPEQLLRRLVMANLLWENNFYVDGQTVAGQIAALVPQVAPETVAALATLAREGGKLRHVPLLLVREMARHPSHRPLVAATLARVIQRPDELTEFLALYWQEGRAPLAAGVKKGLAGAFGKFSEYQLAKYNRDAKIKLKDALRVAHPRPKDAAQADLWKRLNNDELRTPDTWEVELSAGKDKRATWERLLSEQKLGGLALLRNLRGMQAADVDRGNIAAAIDRMNVERLLPFRFLAAARFAPHLEDHLEAAMFRALGGQPKLPGHTILLLDRSGSMNQALSSKSDLTRFDAAAGLAILARELCESCEIHVFYSTGYGVSSAQVQTIPNRRGFALRDALGRPGGGTHLGHAVSTLSARPHDRLIAFTDEETADVVPAPARKGYMLNVASHEHAVGFGPWTRITGFSEQALAWIHQEESTPLQ